MKEKKEAKTLFFFCVENPLAGLHEVYAAGRTIKNPAKEAAQKIITDFLKKKRGHTLTN